MEITKLYKKALGDSKGGGPGTTLRRSRHTHRVVYSAGLRLAKSQVHRPVFKGRTYLNVSEVGSTLSLL